MPYTVNQVIPDTVARARAIIDKLLHALRNERLAAGGWRLAAGG